MRFLMVKLLTATVLSLSLTACVPDAGLVDAGAAKPPAPLVVGAEAYAAKADGSFTVPTVPVEKVPAEFQRQTVDFPTTEAVGTIVINPAARHLFLVTGKNKATRYGIAVGRAGFEWAGEAVITERKTWPTWTPPKEMIARRPELTKWEKGQPGGPENPLGARALYLTTNGVDYGYRIHGTPEWFSIGKNASSGCIRMINQDVMDLYSRVADGAKVVVLNADGSYPKGLKLPPKAPIKAVVTKKAAPAPIVVQMPSVMPIPVVTGPVVVPAPVVAPVVDPAPAAVDPAVVAPVAPAVTAPAVTAPAAVAPAVTAVPCAVALVNGVCPAP